MKRTAEQTRTLAAGGESEKTTKAIVFSLIAAVCLVGAFGCKNKRPAAAPETEPPFLREKLTCDFDTLTKESVSKLAMSFASRHGTNLSDYQAPKVEYIEHLQTWYVFVNQKPPAPVGGHFFVVIDRKSEQIMLIPGM